MATSPRVIYCGVGVLREIVVIVRRQRCSARSIARWLNRWWRGTLAAVVWPLNL